MDGEVYGFSTLARRDCCVVSLDGGTSIPHGDAKVRWKVGAGVDRTERARHRGALSAVPCRERDRVVRGSCGSQSDA